MEPDEFAGLELAEIDHILRERIARGESVGYCQGYRAGMVRCLHQTGLGPKRIALILDTTERDVRAVLRFNALMQRRKMPLGRLVLDLLTRPVY